MGKAGSGIRRSPAQERVPAHSQVPLAAQTHPSRAPQRHAEGDEPLREPQCTPGPGGGHGGQPFGEDTAAAVAIAAEPPADVQLQAHTIRRPGEVGEGAFVMTVDTLRCGGAQRTGHTGLYRAHTQGDLRRGGIDFARCEAQRGGIR